MKIQLLYISPNGTTRGISHTLGEMFETQGYSVTQREVTTPTQREIQDVQAMDMVGIGSPVYELRMLEPMLDYLENYLPRLKAENPEVKAFIYLTYGGITSGKAFMNGATLLYKHGIDIVGGFKVKAPHFYHTEGYPDDVAKETARQFVEGMAQKDYAVMPWEAVKQAFKMQKGITKVIYHLSKLAGKLRALPIHMDDDLCVGCGRCVKACPLGAITLYPLTRDDGRCMHCYHCTTVCQKDAITMDVDRLKAVIASNKKIVGTEVPSDVSFLLD